jgi:hypothetical protein
MMRKFVLAALVVAALGVVVVVLASTRGSATASTRMHVSASHDLASQSFAVFARARQPSDAVPAWLAEGIPTDMPSHRDLDFGRLRLVASNGSDRVFLIPKGDRDVCMLGEFSDRTSSMACAGWASASEPSTPLVAMTSRDSGVRTFGVLADETSDARLVGRSGTSRPAYAARTTAGRAFIARTAEFPTELAWSTPAGRTSMSFAVPAASP